MVFGLNAVVGFACSIGIDMGFNTHHHEEETTITEKGSHHHHDETENHHHKSKDGKDNCCNDKVMKFEQLDKSVPQSISGSINPVFFTAFVTSFYNIDVIFHSQVNTSIKYFVRSYHPPISNIRVLIQSFQI